MELTTGYLSSCESYPSYATLEVTEQTPMHSLPCSDLTDSSSERICTWPVGKKLTATGLYRNTAGNYWYSVTDPDSGKEGYVFAGEVRVKELLWDATITGVDYPEDLSLGSRFWIKGTVSTRYTGLQTVTGSILKNGTVRYTCSVNTSSAFSLLNSKIDDALCFNELEAGGYNYMVSAKCCNYYATDGTTLASPETKTVIVHSNYFSVGGHVHAYTIEEHEAVHPHRCYKRCSCGAYQYTDEYAYVDTCEECLFIKKYSGVCGNSGDNLTWKLDPSTGVLTISGTGFMKDYGGASKTPWHDIKGEIKTVTIGSGVTDVGAYAFSDCSDITSVTLPDSLTAIRKHAFSWCDSIRETEIPENVTLIGEYAFWNAGLFGITVPKRVSSIGRGAFVCLNMKEIIVDADNQYYASENGVLYSKDKTLLHTYPIGETNRIETKWGSKNYFCIPDTVTEIEDDAFWKSQLNEIRMGSSVKTIGYEAFKYCNFDTIVLPASVSCVERYAFANTALKEIYFEGNTPASFEVKAFDECSTDLTIYCKADADGWNTDSSVKWNGHPLKKMLGLGECGKNDYDQLIWTLDANGALSISGSWSMQDYKNYAIDNPTPWYDFCDEIKTVIIGAGVTELGQGAFRNCKNIQKVTMGEDVQTIGMVAFSNCIGLTDIQIPESVASIGQEAFFNCTGLTSIYIPAAVDDIHDAVFAGCCNLTKIFVAADNPKYCSVDNVLFDKNRTNLLCYPAGKTDLTYTVPDSVKTIFPFAVYKNPNLAKIEMSSDAFLCEYSISYCAGLRKINIPAGVPFLGDYFLAQCTSMEAIYSEGDAPTVCIGALWKMAPTCIIYYNPCTTGWTDNDRTYDAAAGTWCGYKLKSTQEQEPDIPENAAIISAEKVGASAGREVRVMLKLTQNPGMNTLRLKVAYDPSVFTLVSAADQGIFDRTPTFSKDITANPYTMVWTSAGNTTANGELVELVFRVAENAAVGTKRITLTAENVFNERDEIVTVATQDVTVNIRKFTPGDANGDGTVDLRDATRLLQFFADWDVTVEQDAADVNGDGEVDLRDVTRLLQYFAGWDVSLAQ